VKSPAVNWLVALVCAVAGGVIGHFGFVWIARQGFYALILPGALIGLMGGWFYDRQRMTSASAFAVVCGVMGLIAGIVSEWRIRPFLANNSFGYFITHLQQLRPITLIMILLGGVFAFWFGLGRRGATPQAALAKPDPSETVTKK
jgi:F0F1-type ATP synthase assembly protein I